MNQLLNCKYVEVIRPGAIVDNASFSTTVVDTMGWGFATFIFHLGTTDIGITALNLQESSESGANFVDVDGLDVNGDLNIDDIAAVLPSATDDGKIFVLQCDLRHRLRYLDLVATMGDGSAGGYASCVCILTYPKIAPITMSGMGAEEILRT
ncbi:hypothetical protein SH467x_003602 [Pirellulaceae bacterium SH467]